jgi:UDP:flavonoid glycosyltransferase YjiC (YdhE family)
VSCFGTPVDGGIDWSFDCQKQVCATEVATVVTDSSAGERVDHQTQSADEIRDSIRRVLTDPRYGEGAEALRQAWLDTPGPTDIVPVLERLTASHRA